MPAAIWPIFGAMFMFRLIVYLYDLRHQPALASRWGSLSYFFLLPNVCFPLFPVVDYKEFRRTYYNQERHRIYQVGVQWIFRGSYQLILYRLVYQHLVLDPASVVTIVDLGQYLLWPFLLYLRVSGQFHIIVGILHLFGFNLTETHRSYFLASSFTDFWRRINIYWKDFMMKIFYYPAFFRLRRRGDRWALVLATVLVFVATWALHSYQWFWIRGAFLFAWNDVLFWTFLALLVVVNSLREWQRVSRRRLVAQAAPWPQAWRSAFSTLGVFATIAVLWSLWSTESLATWFSLWGAAANWQIGDRPWALLFVAGVPLAIVVTVIANSRAWLVRRQPESFERTALVVVGSVAVLSLLSTSAVYSRLGAAGPLIMAVRYGGLNQADAVHLERGYYEDLMGVDRFNGELWSLYMKRPPDWEHTLVDAGLARPGTGFLPFELLPSAEGRFKGTTLRTNRFGLHDREYAIAPPPGCYRLAVLGASHAMGSGVERDRTFEARLEARLNEEQGRCFEILNFAVYGYNAPHHLTVLEEKVLRFQPHAVFYVGHPEDSLRVVRFLTDSVRENRPLPYRFLRDIVAEAGVDPTMAERVVEQRLAPYGERVLAELYRHLVSIMRGQGMCPAFVFMPMVPDMRYAVDTAREIELARAAGFAVLDLSGVYDGTDRESLWVAAWDAHPNAAGHTLVADRLYDLITGQKDLLTCPGPEAGAPPAPEAQ